MSTKNKRYGRPTGNPTPYKYVTEMKNVAGKVYYCANLRRDQSKAFACMTRDRITVSHADARCAALALDKKLIEACAQPINILKPKV